MPKKVTITTPKRVITVRPPASTPKKKMKRAYV